MHRRAHLDLRIHQPGGAHHLLDHLPGMGLFVFGRRRRHKDHLAHTLLKLLQLEWPVVQRTGQTETVLNQGGLAGTVAVVHAPKLPHEYMAFVQEHQGVLGQIVGQSGWRLSSCRTGQVTRVVLNALAMPDLGQHFEIKPRALLQPLGLHQFAHAHQLRKPLSKLFLDQFHGIQNLLSWRHVVAAGIHREARNLLTHFAGQRIK